MTDSKEQVLKNIANAILDARAKNSRSLNPDRLAEAKAAYEAAHAEQQKLLDEALCAINIIREVHTKPDEEVGYVLMVGVSPENSFVPFEDYDAAWLKIYEMLGLTKTKQRDE